MQHFYVWKINRFKRWMLVVLAALFCAVFLWVERDSSFSVFSSQEDPHALVKGTPSEKSIALTFNISWGQEKIYDILEQLKRNSVQATFFVSGEWAERHPDILKEIKDNNHEIGMMGYRYKSYLKQELPKVRKDLLYAKEIFNKLGYKDVNLLRPPSGHFDKKVLDLTDKLGFSVIHWSVNPNDWKNPGTDYIAEYVLDKTSKGDVILLHASDSVKYTDKALEKILPKLKSKGYAFISISEMISKAKTKTTQVN